VTVDPGGIGDTSSLVSPTDFNVEFRIDARFLSQIVAPLGGSLIFVNATFMTQGGPIDWSMTQLTQANVILNGILNTPLVVAGVIDLNAPASIAVDELVSGSNLEITGGDPDLVNALGGAGNGAVLELRSVLFNFVPGLAAIGADLSTCLMQLAESSTTTSRSRRRAPSRPRPTPRSCRSRPRPCCSEQA
jgi:hypothetical protein